MKKFDLGIIVTTLIIIVFSSSLAFFAAKVVGTPKDINLIAKNVSIKLTNGGLIGDAVISPGWSKTNSFTVSNNSKESFRYNIIIKDYINTFETVGNLQYKITSTNGYNMSDFEELPKSTENRDLILAYNISIDKDTTQNYTVEIKYINSEEDQSADMGKTLGGTLYITENTNKIVTYNNGSIGSKLLSDNTTKLTRASFDSPYTKTNTNTLFTSTEDNTLVYYFAGDAKNNWVKFGGYYWRIIRTNADGSIRLLYHGTSTTAEDAYIGTSSFNNTTDKSYYVGYMYSSGVQRGNATDSTIKTVVDKWYSENLKVYEDYISDTAVYCNNRSLNPGETWTESGNNFGYNTERFVRNRNFTYNCDNNDDKFSVCTSTGNGILKYPIALISADELVLAGAVYNKNNNNAWYFNNSNNISSTGDKYWWTMTPWSFEISTNSSQGLFAGGNTYAGAFGDGVTKGSHGVRPVISINANNIYKSGNGSSASPYEIEATASYEVTLTVNNGTGSGKVNVKEGNNATFTVTPNSGYKLELETNTCGGTLSGNTYTISNITSNKTCSITFKSSTPTLYAKLLADKTTRPDRGSFSSVLTTDNTKTLYTGTENGTTVYYFAGNATDNWVKFGKNKSNQDLYWRIIRTNADGGVRLLYHGTSTTATDAVINTSTAFNTTYNNPMYVGYMYGTSGSLVNNRTNANNSTIKTTIDNWYKDNLNTNYGKYISTTAVYCNDRSVTNGTYSTSSSFDYAAYTRLGSNKTPSYDCSVTEDKFTVDTSTGNGKLTYPIALMTADEVSFAGGVYGTNAPTWYYYNSANGSSTGSTWWWLLSPSNWNGSYARVFSVRGSSYPGELGNYYYVDGAGGVRPAISLKFCVKYASGDGSANAPYEIVETTSGC